MKKMMINSLALIFTIVSLTSCSSDSESVNEPIESAKSYTHNVNELELLDKELNNQSFEITYNLALIYEASSQLEIANKLYRNAKTLTLDIKYLDLINYAIERTSINLEEKIKAKSQLP